MNAANTKAKLPRWTDPKQGGRDVTPHGFRSSFRDWVSDETNFSSELAEAAIAHIDGDEAEQNRANRETKLAYKRTDFYEKRRPLMTAWADHCNQPVDDAKVVRPKFGGFNG